MSIATIGVNAIRQIITTVAVWLGISAVTFVGFDALQSQVRNFIASNLGNVGSEAAGLMGLMGIDICINMILSAFAIRIVVMGTSRIRRA